MANRSGARMKAASPEPMNIIAGRLGSTAGPHHRGPCSWVPGSRASRGPRN